jgi:glycosyltransferase involved in cell wall biosynthesis
VFNGANYLASAIESALAQTYESIEVIVVNDGSNDGGATEAVALSFRDQIKYYRKPNGHVASALNFGIRHMSGDFFSWLSHDDLYKPEKIALQIAALHERPPNTIAYGDFEILDVATGAITPVRMNPVPPEHFRYHITLDNSLHGCTLLIPKACLDATGPFNEQLRTTQDYDMWFRLARCCRFEYVPGIVVVSRHHPQQGSIALRDLAQPECDQLLTAFVGELTPKELEAGAGTDLVRAYLTVAANLNGRRFPVAAKTALTLARSRMSGSSAVQKLRFLADWLYICGLVQNANWLRGKLRAVTQRVAALRQ